MQISLVGQILCGGEGEARSDDAFDSGVVGEIEEHRGPLHSS